MQIKIEKICPDISIYDKSSLTGEPVDRNLLKLLSNNDKHLKLKF